MAGYGQAIGGIFSGMGETLPSAAKTLTDEARSRRNEALALPVAQYNKAVAEDNLKKLTTMHKKEDLFRKSDIAKYYWEAGETFGFIQPGATEINELTREKIHEFMLGKGAPYMTTRIMELYNKNRESVGKFGPLKQNTQAELDQIDEELSQYPQSVIGADEKLAKKMQKRQELQKQMAFYNQQENIENQGLKSLEQPLRMYMDYGARDIIKSTWPLEKQDTAIAMYEEWVRGDKGAINPLENKGAVDARIAIDKEEAEIRKEERRPIKREFQATKDFVDAQGRKYKKGEIVAFNLPSGTPTPEGFKEKEESFKAKNLIGRGWVSKRQIMQHPNTGVAVYEDSYDNGRYEKATPEDLANMRPSTIKPIGDQAATELSGLKNTYDRLTDVAIRAEKLKEKFGPLQGRWEKLKVKFMEDKDVQYAINEINTMITIAYQLSGKQITPEEMKMLREAILPQLEQPYGNFVSTLEFAKNWTAKLHDDRIRYYEDLGFDIPNANYILRKKAAKKEGTSGRELLSY